MIFIDDKKYKANTSTTLKNKTKKKRIVLIDSMRASNNMLNYNKILTNYHNPIWPNYTVDRNGEIYKHMNDDQYSSIINDDDVDSESISIMLSNSGFLYYLHDKYVNWIGDVVEDKEVGVRNFYGYFHWEKYKSKQYDSLKKLIKYLTNIHDQINNKTVPNNLFRDDVLYLNGVVSKSSIIKKSISVNPLFDFEKLNMEYF